LASSEEFLLGGLAGEKWLRVGDNFISYDYYGPTTAEALEAGAGSFGIHVTLDEADPDLEYLMDMVAASVVFNK
jgi:hypothetical protein